MTELSDFPIVVHRPIAWGQMDAFQHVNNVEYFRFFEDARIAYFEAASVYSETTNDEPSGVAPILAATSCKFLRPLTYPDDIAIGARTTDIGADRFTLEYAIKSEQADRLVAIGDSVVVSYDYETAQKVDLPDEWREAIERVESS